MDSGVIIRSKAVAEAHLADTSLVEEPAASRRKARPSLVRVRLAEPRDVEGIKAVVRSQHARTMFGSTPISERKLAANIERAIRPSASQCGLVAEAHGRVVGVAWASAGEYMLTEGELMATVQLIAVDREACGPYLSARTFIRLMQAVTIWSAGRDATRVLVHVTTGTALKRTNRLLQAGGAHLVGGAYVAKIGYGKR